MHANRQIFCSKLPHNKKTECLELANDKGGYLNLELMKCPISPPADRATPDTVN